MVYIGKPIMDRFVTSLSEQELSPATIQKYERNLKILTEYAGDYLSDKEHLNRFRQYLLNQGFCGGTINSIVGTVNKLFEFMESAKLIDTAWKMRGEKIQNQNFVPEDRELSFEEYERLVRAANERGDTRLAMLLQTIASLGIRVSEVCAVTVESLREGFATVRNKGKTRTVPIPQTLVDCLTKYCAEKQITAGPVFITRNGKPLDRSNIWRMFKKLADAAAVAAKKIFPHNLRHLFARTYHSVHHDMAGLAAVLGHSNINTTRIYTANSGHQEREKMNRLNLVFPHIYNSSDKLL